jgi:hypothetical protein
MDDTEDSDAGVAALAWKAALDATASDGEDDEEEDAFAKLDAALGPYAPPQAAHDHDHHASAPPSSPAPSTAGQRLKRKNLSKALQLLSLQRYAAAAREAGRLPGREETQALLQRAHAEFLAQGGAPGEPHLTPPEFLKLIRNRRREIHARARQQSAPLTRGKAKARARSPLLTAAKQRLREENERIRALIEAIDQARARSNSLRPVLPPAPRANPQDHIEAILQVHRETRAVQQEIAERVESIQRMLHHHDGMEEPSSASV